MCNGVGGNALRHQQLAVAGVRDHPLDDHREAGPVAKRAVSPKAGMRTSVDMLDRIGSFLDAHIGQPTAAP